jgi:hypothetical protein
MRIHDALGAALPLLLLLTSSSLAPARAQDKPQEQPVEKPAAREAPSVNLKVDVVISRFQGDKKVSSVPYTLSVDASARGETSVLRIGSRVPVPGANAMPPPTDGKPQPPVSFSYQDIGTNIDCMARLTPDGRFRLQLRIDENSVHLNDTVEPGASSPAVAPVFRAYRATNVVVVRDGQTTEFTAATDRINGDTVRVSVTARVNH